MSERLFLPPQISFRRMANRAATLLYHHSGNLTEEETKFLLLIKTKLLELADKRDNRTQVSS